MQVDFAAQHVDRPYKVERLNFGLALLWIAATAVGWFAIVVGSGVGWLMLLIPALAALMGELQRRVLKRSGYNIHAGWTARTALGWLAGSISMFVILQIMSAVHHSARNFSALGLFGVRGDQVEVTTQVAGLALMGAIIGAFQWFGSSQLRNCSQLVGQVVPWSVINAVAWGAGAVAGWAVVKAFIIGYEPICVDCIISLFWSGMAIGLVIAVVTGFALWNRLVGALLGVAVGIVAAYLVLNNMTVGLAGKMGIFETNPGSDYDPEVSICNAQNIPSLITPTAITAFDPRHMGPSRVLDPSRGETQSIALSKDGAILAAQKNHWEQGYVVESRVLIWQTSDWKLIGTIPLTNSTISAQQTASAAAMSETGYRVVSGTLITVTPAPIASLQPTTIDYPGGIQATAVLSPDGKVHIWDASDSKHQSELNSVDLQSTPTSTLSPDGKMVITKLLWTAELRRTSDCALIAYLRKPPQLEYSSPNRLVFAFSSDSRFIAGGSQNGGVWVWDVPH